jgi:hypothetical protein
MFNRKIDNEKFPWVTLAVVVVLYTLFAYMRISGDASENVKQLWYFYAFLSNTFELLQDTMAIWTTVLFLLTAVFRLGIITMFSFVSLNADTYPIYGFRLFRSILISSVIAFVLEAIAMNFETVSQSPFFAQAVARLIITSIFTYCIYIFYDEDGNQKLITGCILFFLFQMILDVMWTLATVLS